MSGGSSLGRAPPYTHLFDPPNLENRPPLDDSATPDTTRWRLSRPGSTFVKKITHMADIVGTAIGAGSFNTLVAAVKAAGLVETL